MRVENAGRATRRITGIIILCLGLLTAEASFAQATLATRPGNAGLATQTNCVILERMGTVGQVTSRVMSFGVRGSEFQFVEGKLPEGTTFHNKLTERDVRNLQASGADVVILDSDYMPTALMEAREGCLKAARRANLQASAASPTQVEIASSPAGSDIEIDGKFVGSTPSLVRVAAGEHTVKLTKDGFEVWQRTLTTMSGSVRISPDLQPLAPATATVPASASAEEGATTLDTVANRF
ncbi:MAG: PEGA domain-containing protein [Candidatus Korobacteraceae bacterium]